MNDKMKIECIKTDIDKCFSAYNVNSIDTKFEMPNSGKTLKYYEGTFNLIVAKSGHGKTSYSTFLNAYILENTEYNTAYISIEELPAPTIARIGTALENLNKDTPNNQNYEAILSNLKTSKTREPLRINKLIEEERTYISDHSKLSEIVEFIESFSNKNDKNKFIFIDYLQLIRTETNSQNRVNELQNICNTLLQTAKQTSTILIMNVQVNKEAKTFEVFDTNTIREAQDIVFTSNIILGIWNETVIENEKGETNKYDKPTQDIKIKVMKNRLGDTQHIDMEFDFKNNIFRLDSKKKTPSKSRKQPSNYQKKFSK